MIRDVDVVVLGGGPAGLGAAVAAARSGRSVLLVERYGFLGGNGTAAMVTNYCGLYATVRGEPQRVVTGVVDDVLSTLAEVGGLNEPQTTPSGLVVQSYDTAALKYAADKVCLAAGVELLFHCFAVGAIVEDRRIRALLVESKSGRAAIVGRVFIDCSGDADLAAWAQAGVVKGGADGYIAYPTMMFRMGAVDGERAETVGIPLLRERAKDARIRGEHSFLRQSPIARAQAHAGEWRANMTQVTLDGGPVDGTNVEHLTRGEIIGRAQAIAAAAYLKKEIPGFEKSYLLEVAPQLGIRETRRLVGAYELTGDDVRSGRQFDDGIACSGWPIEMHVLGGIQWASVGGRGYYDIPYRALLPREIDNLLVAGRCLSSSQEAQSSARVSGPCIAMGQAAGSAAAMAIDTDRAVGRIDVGELRRALRDQGAFLGT